MTPPRKILAAFAALVAATSLAAAPAYAGGISMHTAGQQLKADVEPLVPAFMHFEAGIKQWAKENPGATDLSATQPIVSDMVKTIAGVGHRFHSQRWPAQYMADVRSLERATTALRAEIARYPSLNARDVNSWGAKAQDDLEAFGHAGDVLSADLGLT